MWPEPAEYVPPQGMSTESKVILPVSQRSRMADAVRDLIMPGYILFFIIDENVRKKEYNSELMRELNIYKNIKHLQYSPILLLYAL